VNRSYLGRSGHVEVFEDEPVVGLDQRVADLVQEMAPHGVTVVTP
jgi:hypothetical protein